MSKEKNYDKLDLSWRSSQTKQVTKIFFLFFLFIFFSISCLTNFFFFRFCCNNAFSGKRLSFQSYDIQKKEHENICSIEFLNNEKDEDKFFEVLIPFQGLKHSLLWNVINYAAYQTALYKPEQHIFLQEVGLKIIQDSETALYIPIWRCVSYEMFQKLVTMWSYKLRNVQSNVLSSRTNCKNLMDHTQLYFDEMQQDSNIACVIQLPVPIPLSQERVMQYHQDTNEFCSAILKNPSLILNISTYSKWALE